ncbi:hypothetical protein BX659_1602 [Orenia metallireducens]|uniref:Uncharacterized protein n=1 Tax=Orenia metallireducens TaxID=1413210 RepID=A0A285IL69_9FIRM|nr:hypothetical protein [Orenia metallireducens]PRX16921.1 hypothetical protein BX659_1602 [Orenia metallireducens]SNY47846.1 hypothetical protein SAMN06265827_1602 [Orenia metallireducens]
MQVSAVNSQVNYYQNTKINNTKVNKNTNIKNIINESKSENKKVTDSPTIEEISKKYDITNATFDEFRKISKALCDNGKISKSTYFIMIFNPEESPHWKEFTKDIPNASYFRTKADSHGRRNWIEEFEAKLEGARRVGNLLGAKNHQKILNALKELTYNQESKD